jgi:hypothetical protein
MFDKWFKLPAHLYLRLTALTILTVGITLSNVLMSIGAIWIISNWIIEADYKNSWERIKQNKSVWFVLFIFFLGMLSLFWSENLAYGVKDLRVKLPFLVIPFVMAASKPLPRHFFHFLLFVFLGMVAFTSAYNYLHFYSGGSELKDIREMSLFISHVRFSTLTVLAIFIAFYCFLNRIGFRWMMLILIPWFLYYLYLSQVINGYLLLVIISLFSLFYGLKRIPQANYRRWAIMGLIALLTTGGIVSFKFLSSFVDTEEQGADELAEYTPNGNPYVHDTSNKFMENGHLVWINVSQKELRSEWNKRSNMAYDSLDRKEQPLSGTLMRYITSKGLRKDSIAVWSLTESEIQDIENGVCSAVASSGLKARVQSFLHEYQMYQSGGDPNGHSLLQRMEHIKTAIYILKEKWLLGTGVGDLPAAFDQAYLDTNSKLIEENRWHSHNQYLSLWISHGILGLLAFIIMILYPLFEKKADYFTWIVTIALFASCLFQDVLETQAGVTIFALFYALSAYRESQNSSTQSKED